MWSITIDNIKKLGVNDLILFHSASGKDSIALCDILSKNFRKVLCVFMYIVKDLNYENGFIEWATNRYKNIEFIKVPHFCLSSWIRNGYLGIKKQKIKNYTLSGIDRLIRNKHKLDFSVYGSKKVDGLQRRIMLNTYKDGISYNTRKAYPLMDMKNKEVLYYIKDNYLIEPFKYCNEKPSSGCDISDPRYLYCVRDKYPNDYNKILNIFPLCEAILQCYENKAIRNANN